MNNEVKNVPELRFPEFSGEWKEKELGQCTNLITKGTTPKDKSGKGTINYIKVENIYNGKINPRMKININEHEGYLKRSKLEANDILFSIAGTLGRTAVVNKSHLPANTNQALAIIRGYDFETNFLITTLGGHAVAKYIRKNPTVGAQPNLSLNQVSKLIINTPSKNEQQKIGDFFSKLDRQIELEEQKLAKLEEQKKGYMQKIFSQELRFKDENGNDYPNWEIEKLGDLINEVNERTISNNQYELLSSTKNGLLSQEEYFKKQIGSKDSTGYKILRLNQLVLSPQNLWLGNINFNQRFDIGIVSPSYRIYNLSHHFDINFAKYLLKSPRYIYEYAQASEQGASVVRRNLNLDLFYSIIISLPSIKEQRKIGSFLNKLDKLIEKQSDKIELLKERKKGFLQKMFV